MRGTIPRREQAVFTLGRQGCRWCAATAMTDEGPQRRKKVHFVLVVTAPGRAPPQDHVQQRTVPGAIAGTSMTTKLILAFTVAAVNLVEATPRHDRQIMMVAIAGSTLLLLMAIAVQLIGS